MKAFHNWGRWVAHCDSPVCASAAQLEAGQASFVCQCRDTQICQHGPLCATVVKVEWPESPEAIEEVLAARRLENRHWYPHETVEDLERENVEHEVSA